MNGPVFCFPGVVDVDGTETRPAGLSLAAWPEWRERTATAPPWLAAQIRAVAVGLAGFDRLLLSGIEPAVITSHSLGVYAALSAAGSLEAEAALEAAWRAGELLEENLRRAPGGLLAIVGLPLERIERIVEKVGGTLSIASRNTGSQFVIGGSDEDLARAEREIAGDALQVEPIRAGGPLHTALMDPIVSRMRDFVEGIEIREPERPYLCHQGATYLRSPSEIREAMATQIREPVLWSACLERLGREGAWLFVDMGPGAVLKKSIRWVLRSSRAFSLAEGATAEAIAAAMRERSGVAEGE